MRICQRAIRWSQGRPYIKKKKTIYFPQNPKTPCSIKQNTSEIDYCIHSLNYFHSVK